MAALDFPASPTDGQVYGNWIWNAAKGAWKAKPLTAMKATPSDTAPLNPANGDEWLNTIDGCLYVYYTDVDGSQWVQVKNDASFSSTLGPRVDAMEANDNRNYIINGAFDIWQRGTSFGAVNAYTADRWYSEGNSSTAQGTLNGSDISPVPGISNFARISRTSNLSTYPSLAQRIEDVTNFAGQTITISFYARQNTAFSSGNWQFMYGQFFGSGGSTAVANYTAGIFTPTSSWQRFTLTVSVPSISGKTIGAGNFFLAGIRNDSPSMTTGQLDVTGFQLQAGSLATAFHRNAPSLQAELAACQRYYYQLDAIGGLGQNMGMGYQTSTTVAQLALYIPVVMRSASPTVAYSGVEVTDDVSYNQGITGMSVRTGKSVGNIMGITVTNGAGGAQYRPCFLRNTSATSYIAFSTEL